VRFGNYALASETLSEEKEAEVAMSETTIDDMCDQLIYVGWKLEELDRLCAFLRSYAPPDEDRSEAETRQLEFLRYLVQTGRLID
jgi:hypothetical protein